MLKERIFQFLENEKNKKNKLMLHERIFIWYMYIPTSHVTKNIFNT